MITLEFIKIALKEYGARLNPTGEIISPKGKNTGIIPKKMGRRLRMEISSNSDLVSSGPLNQEFVCSFVEKYWFWEKLPVTKR